MALSSTSTDTGQVLYGSTSSAFNFIDATFTVALRVKWTFTDFPLAAAVSKGGSADGLGASMNGWVIALNGQAVGKLRCFYKQNRSPSLSIDAYTTTSGYNDGNWHSFVCQLTTSSTVAAANVATIMADGAYDYTQVTSPIVTDTHSTDALAIGSRGYPSNPSGGMRSMSIADVGIWAGSLTDDEKKAYCKGFHPYRNIRPQNLRWVPPLVREWIDLKGMSLTAVSLGSAASPHPRVYG